MGEDYKRHCNKEELEEMKKQIHIAMKEGCLGMSVGLDYDPDVFASKEEIDECVSVLKEYNGVYHPHWRRTGRRRGIAAGHRKVEKIQGILECIDTCRKTGVRLHFAHYSTGWYIEPTPPDILEEANIKASLQVIDKAREEGLDVTFNAIPFIIQGGFHAPGYLCGLLAPWLRVLGSREALGRWLKAEDYREEIKDDLRRGKWFWRIAWNPNTNPRWAENITILRSKSPNCDGKTLAEIAEERGKDPMDVFFDIIVDDPDTWAVLGPKKQNPSYKLFYMHPAGMVGLDTIAFDEKWQMKYPPYSCLLYTSPSPRDS